MVFALIFKIFFTFIEYHKYTKLSNKFMSISALGVMFTAQLGIG
jgi:hypothetical protein